MAITIQTIATTAWNAGGSGTLTITKPTGLTAGDTMLAFCTAKEGAPTVTWDDKAGWTTVGSASFDGVGTKVYAKIADAGDAAASNFTFTVNVTDSQCGIMYRLTGTTQTMSEIIINNANTSSGSTTQTCANTITPSANSLIILHFFRKDFASSGSGQTIATSPPTFTERLDTTTTAATDVSCNNSSGIRPESTATGDSTVVWSTGTGTSHGIQVGVPEPAAVTATGGFFRAALL